MKSTRWLVGADEAGRGSLVGEMIVAVAAIPENLLDVLIELGVRDSKELTPEKRRELYKILSKTVVFSVQPVKPYDIDRRSLTILTEEAIAAAASRVLPRIEGVVARFVVDKYGKPRRLRAYLAKLGYRGPIIIEEKADSRYLEVSTASIIAKHVRDSRIRVLSSLYGVEGSGYPSDPRTVEWVLKTVERGERPPIIRYSWGTLERVGARLRKPREAGRPTLEDFM